MKTKEQTEKPNFKTEKYKRVPNVPFLYVNERGEVYSTKEKRMLKVRKLKTSLLIRTPTETGEHWYCVKKMILAAFAGIPMRDGTIKHIDGDTNNYKASNLKYCRLMGTREKNEVNKADLLTAIRCYISVPKRLKVTINGFTKMFLCEVAKKRRFVSNHLHDENIEVFRTYLSTKETFSTNSITDTAKINGIGVLDTTYIINHFTTILVNEVLSDLKNGKLEIKDYYRKPRKQDELKKYNEYLIKNGIEPIKLKKRLSPQKEYEAHCKKLQAKFEARSEAIQNL